MSILRSLLKNLLTFIRNLPPRAKRLWILWLKTSDTGQILVYYSILVVILDVSTFSWTIGQVIYLVSLVGLFFIGIISQFWDRVKSTRSLLIGSVGFLLGFVFDLTLNMSLIIYEGLLFYPPILITSSIDFIAIVNIIYLYLGKIRPNQPST